MGTFTSRTRRLPRSRRFAALAVAIPLALVAACGDDDETSTGQESGGGGGGGGGGGTAAEIVSPADGDTVEPNFDLELSSTEEIGDPDTGNFHYHVFVDGDEEDYEIVYEDSHAVERDLPAGEHTVEAALANPDHSLVEDATRDEITITVGEGGGGAGGGSTETTGDDTTTTSADDGGNGY